MVVPPQVAAETAGKKVTVWEQPGAVAAELTGMRSTARLDRWEAWAGKNATIITPWQSSKAAKDDTERHW
jgi:hypothetical protein